MTAVAMSMRELNFEELDLVFGGGKGSKPKSGGGSSAGGENADLADQIRDIADFISGFIDGWKEKD